MPSQSANRRTPRRRRSHDHPDSDSVTSWNSLSRTPSCSSTSSSSDDGLTSKLPTLPDLRFEQSYLATIRGFLHEDRPSEAESDDKDHHHKVDVTHSAAKDEHELWLGNLRVEWFPIVYVTVRDQLLSPLVQGAVWGLGGLLLTQFRQYLSARRVSNANRAARRPNISILNSLGLGKR